MPPHSTEAHSRRRAPARGTGLRCCSQQSHHTIAVQRKCLRKIFGRMPIQGQCGGKNKKKRRFVPFWNNRLSLLGKLFLISSGYGVRRSVGGREVSDINPSANCPR